MRIANIFLISFFLATTSIFAQRFVQPKKDKVKIYKNEKRSINEQAILTVGRDDRLKVVRTKKNHFQVRAENGTIGWVERQYVVSASGKAFQFDDAEVIGYLDSPTPVYIIDADSKDATPIKLDRSFAEALRENVDRETVERLNE